MATASFRSALFLVVFVLMGVLGIYLLTREILFDQKAVPGTATVLEYRSRRLGQGTAEVMYELDGKPVQATVDTWFNPVERGDKMEILYDRDNPGKVKVNSTWQRYTAPIGVLLLSILFTCDTVVRWLRSRRVTASADPPVVQPRDA